VFNFDDMDLRQQQPENISEALSAYVDNQLNFVERRKVEELIASNPTYAQEVEELRLLKSWIRELPTPAPRRSFTLDPAIAPRPRRLLFPTLRWATVAAAVLLMLTLSVDALSILGGMGGAGSATSATAGGGTAATAASPAALAQDFRSEESAAGGATASPGAATMMAQPQQSGPATGAASPAAGAAASPDSAEAVPESDVPEGAEENAGAAAMSSPSTAEDGAEASTTGDDASTADDTAGQALSAPSPVAGGEAANVAEPSLSDSQSSALETVDTEITTARDSSFPLTTWRIAQLVLLATTVALGTGAWLASRRNI
jgi:hypothetical protein